MTSAALMGGLAAPVGAYAMTTGRLMGTAAALVALAGVVIGVLALARPAGRNEKTKATIALAAGLFGIALGGLVVAVADGGPGTGAGIVGGFAAVAIGLIATVLGWLALSRSRRTA